MIPTQELQAVTDCRNKLDSELAKFIPHCSMYTLEFRELPTDFELASYAMHRACECRDKIKAAKGRTGRMVREHNQKMFERWKNLTHATNIRVESMADAKSQGKKMRVYF